MRVSSVVTVVSWSRRYLAFLRESNIPVANQLPVQLPKDRDQGLRFTPTDNEVKRWVEACEYAQQPYRALLALLPATGLRDSEIGQLKADAWRVLDDGRVIFTATVTKNAKPRELSLLKSGLPVFKRYMFEWRNGIDSPWLFPLAHKPAEHVSRKLVERQVRLTRVRADLPEATCHAFRRYFVGHLLDLRVDHPVIAKMIGHSNLATFMKYYGPTGEALAKHMDQAGV